MVFQGEHKANGKVECYKMWVVTKGFSQIERIDYEETFARFATYTSIRMLLGICFMMKFIIHQIDVKTSFFHIKFKEDVYMVQLERYEKLDSKELVCKLQKTIHGLQQALQVWNEKIDGFLKQKGYKQYRLDIDIYMQMEQKQLVLYLVLYAYDLLIFNLDVDEIRRSRQHSLQNLTCRI